MSELSEPYSVTALNSTSLATVFMLLALGRYSADLNCTFVTNLRAASALRLTKYTSLPSSLWEHTLKLLSASSVNVNSLWFLLLQIMSCCFFCIFVYYLFFFSYLFYSCLICPFGKLPLKHILCMRAYLANKTDWSEASLSLYLKHNSVTAE